MSDSDSDEKFDEYSDEDMAYSKALKKEAELSKLSGPGSALVCPETNNSIAVETMCDVLFDALGIDCFPANKEIYKIFGLQEYDPFDPPIWKYAPIGVVVFGAWQSIRMAKLAKRAEIHTAVRDGTLPEKFYEWICKEPERYSSSGYMKVLRNKSIFAKIHWEIPRLLQLSPRDSSRAKSDKACIICKTSIYRVLKKCPSCSEAWYCSETCQRNHWKKHLEESIISWPEHSCSINHAWEKIFDAAYEADELDQQFWGLFGLKDFSGANSTKIKGKLLRNIVLGAWSGIIVRFEHPSICNPEDVQQALFDGNLPDKFYEWISIDNGFAFNVDYMVTEDQIILRDKNVFNKIKWTIPKLEGLDLKMCQNCQTRNSPSTAIGRVLMKCGRCFNVWYCSKTCQVQHWPTHKTQCKAHPEKNAN